MGYKDNLGKTDKNGRNMIPTPNGQCDLNKVWNEALNKFNVAPDSISNTELAPPNKVGVVGGSAEYDVVVLNAVDIVNNENAIEQENTTIVQSGIVAQEISITVADITKPFILDLTSIVTGGTITIKLNGGVAHPLYSDIGLTTAIVELVVGLYKIFPRGTTAFFNPPSGSGGNEIVAGNIVLAGADTLQEIATAEANYVLRKEIRVTLTGICRVEYKGAYFASTDIYMKIYINGLPVGVETQILAQYGSFQTVSEDFEVKPEDLVQLYVKNGSKFFIKEFRVKIQTMAIVTLD